MGKIQREIKALEAEIELNQKLVRLNSALLHVKLQSSPVLLGVAMVTGFAAGCWIGFKFDKNTAKEQIARAPGKILSLLEHVRIFLPLLPL